MNCPYFCKRHAVRDNHEEVKKRVTKHLLNKGNYNYSLSTQSGGKNTGHLLKHVSPTFVVFLATLYKIILLLYQHKIL